MQRLTQQTALFIAGLSGQYRSIADAIEAHVFVQRVAPLSNDVAVAAVQTAIELGFTEQDSSNRVRLSSKWCAERDRHAEAEGNVEAGESQLASVFLAHQSQIRDT